MLFHFGLHAKVVFEIPLAGNMFQTAGNLSTSFRNTTSGKQNWESAETVYSIWFSISKPADLELSLIMENTDEKSKIRVSVLDKSFIISTSSGGINTYPIGLVKATLPGYIRVDLRGMEKSGLSFGRPISLQVAVEESDLIISYVKDNVDNRFYWGRRGPSVHLSYKAPDDTDLEWFYSEITVPEGEDIIGSYYMANGFAEGYFGMQVNSETERRVIFSVWSPFVTDNPEEIPEEDRIRVIRKGEHTIAHDFGNEGSGGHSRILFPWKAGVTYRFLNRVIPGGNGNTLYSAWFFAPEVGEWQFLTTFSRPKTDTWLKRPHSFLENFIDRNGYLGRKAWYGNQWVCDKEGKWHRITEARFTGDDIARRGYRLDYAGGAEGSLFFLQNGGFFHPPVELNSMHQRNPGNTTAPAIDFNTLP
jgi:hypothetical protein